MAALVLESLVLRDVAVLVDVLAVDLRLGISAAYTQAQAKCNSLRHPLSSWQPANPVGNEPDVGDTTSGTMPGAGRSRRSSGHSVGSGRTAGSIGGTLRFTRIPMGDQAKAAAANLLALQAGFVAFAGEGLPASRTPPAMRATACR